MNAARALWVLALIVVVGARAYPDEGEGSQKATKVTSQSMAGQESGMEAASSAAADQTNTTDAAIEKDLGTITADVRASTAATVIKAGVLALAIALIAFRYIPRRRKGGDT